MCLTITLQQYAKKQIYDLITFDQTFINEFTTIISMFQDKQSDRFGFLVLTDVVNCLSAKLFSKFSHVHKLLREFNALI